MTTLNVKNNHTAEVTVYITLGVTPGCIQNVSRIIGADIIEMHPLMGHFKLAPAAQVTLSTPPGQGFNGNFSFNTPPLNCPTPEFPDGVVLAEFIINNKFQNNGQETIDISCVAGANAFVEFEMSTDDWTTNGGNIVGIKKIQNGTKLDNTGKIGVFPYGCDNCTSSVNPPSCVGIQSQYANRLPICNVQRPARGNKDGSITVIYQGPTPGSI